MGLEKYATMDLEPYMLAQESALLDLYQQHYEVAIIPIFCN